MELRLLGPVEAVSAGVLVDIGPPRQRGVLAALAADVGRPLPVASLVDRVWGENPPARVRETLYTYVTRLRAIFADHGPRLARRSGGYLLDLDPVQVDVHRFGRLVKQARAPHCSDVARAELLRSGLELWRGTPLAGMPGEWAAGVRQTWQQQRIDAALSWARVGDPVAVIDELTGLVLAHPLHEPLATALMRALHTAGRTDEALACYRKLRQELADQLDVEPGADAQRAHQAILRGDLDEPPRPTVTRRQSETVPAQLPADVAGFTGRLLELRVLQESLTTAGTAMVITAVAGTAGVGKTALTVRFAHLVRDRFPDGQLHLDLRGYDHEQPVAPGDALAAFLRALGVPPPQIPADVDERAALYRTLLSRRRMLVLLDNASTVDQVGPLLPGSPLCLVLVTSRDSLPGLVSRHGARRLDLDVLPVDEAIILLRRLVGPQVDAEAAAALADQCGRLPLALRIAAELAITQPEGGLAELVEDLADEQRRLDLLDAGADPRTGIRAVFACSYRQLAADAARAFRVLGTHPCLDVDPYAAAALLDADLSTTKRLLDALTRTHLLHRTGPHRFGMHDLLRVYAAELETAEARHAALTRLFDHYLRTITAAMNLLVPGDRHRRPDLPAPGTVLTDPLAWADAERANLIAAVRHAAAHDHPAHAIQLAAVLRQYLDIGGHYDDALAVQTTALRAARDHDDQAGEAIMLAGLGTVHLRRADYPQAADLYRQALDLRDAEGNRTEQAHLLINLGNVRHMQGRFDEAVELYRQALALHEQRADRMGTFRVLHNLGNTIRALGDHPQAIDHLTRALELIREIGDRDGEAHSLDDLGYIHLRLGDHTAAAEHCQQALDAYEEVGNPLGIAHALNNLAAIRLRQHEPAAATDLGTRALALYREIGARNGEAQTLTTLGCIAAEQGDLELATTHHRAAVTLFIRTGSAMGEANALNNLGTVSSVDGRQEDAHAEHSDALAIAERIGDRYERFRALAGLGHREQALDGFLGLGVSHAAELQRLTSLKPAARSRP